MSYSVQILLTCLASYGHWCTSGTTVTEVTNHLLSDLKSPPQKGAPACYVNLVRSLWLGSSWPLEGNFHRSIAEWTSICLSTYRSLRLSTLSTEASSAEYSSYMTEFSALRKHLKSPDPAWTHKAQGSSWQRGCKDRAWGGIL